MFGTKVDDLSIGDLIDEVIDHGMDCTRHGRACPRLPDRSFLREGLLRCLSHADSGRDWLQQASEAGRTETARSTFFPALHSERRRQVVTDVAEAVCRRSRRMLEEMALDYLAPFPELAGLACLAGDGHTIEHAVHASRRPSGRRDPVSTIYLLDLRTGLMQALAQVNGDGKRRHEWPVFRRQAVEAGGWCGSQRGTVYVLDRAYIDNPFWTLTARRAGCFMVTRMKENMKPLMKEPLEFDRDDPANVGVQGVYTVGFGNAGTMTLVEFTDPETDESFQFITTLEDIRPGVVAWLYFLRWKIEKAYDTFKNDFGETKAWANGECANAIQAAFLAMAYSICRVLQYRMQADHGLRDEKVEHKFQSALERRKEKARAQRRRILPLHSITAHVRMAKMSAQFIRTVRNHLYSPKPLRALLAMFAAALLRYL